MSTRKNLPKGITEVPSGYRARIYVDFQQHHLGIYPTLKDAKAALSIAQSQKARGTFVPLKVRRAKVKALQEQQRAEEITVRAWGDVWLEALAGDKGARRTAKVTDHARSPGTVRTYKSTLQVHVFDAIGDINLADVTPDDVQTVVDEAQASGHAAASNVVRTLRALFNAAINADVGGVKENPVTLRLPKPRPSGNIHDRIATPQQVRELAAAMPEELGLAVYLATWCALRQGEVLGLQRRDFTNLDSPGEARVQIQRQWHSKSTPPAYTEPKRGSQRTIHVPESIAALVTEHMAKYVASSPEAPIFPGQRNPARPVSQSVLDRHWRAARDSIRPGLRFHDLRHTGLTEYARTGATLKELMNRGGHTDIEVAMVYQAAAEERDRALTAKMDTAITGEYA